MLLCIITCWTSRFILYSKLLTHLRLKDLLYCLLKIIRLLVQFIKLLKLQLHLRFWKWILAPFFLLCWFDSFIARYNMLETSCLLQKDMVWLFIDFLLFTCIMNYFLFIQFFHAFIFAITFYWSIVSHLTYFILSYIYV